MLSAELKDCTQGERLAPREFSQEQLVGHLSSASITEYYCCYSKLSNEYGQNSVS
ncbi:hypothetical protein FDUTEX481_10107 [Tolypothrix sp. PCC 7601]|nr:hypothetical protein FDUTEX481_10107 [Tolypothrix sp. PCC 7601]